jgi:DNA-binding PucR family transcriptional regulator
VLSDLIAANPELRSGRIATLLAHDREHHTCYAESLSAYLDAFGDVNRAASTLNIHPNTLRYRVRRVAEICGLDLDDPDERLMAAIQLRTSMLAEPANSPLPVGALA